MRLFSRERKGKRRLFKRKTLFKKAVFPFSRVGKIASRRGLKIRGALISVPLALREEPQSIKMTSRGYFYACFGGGILGGSLEITSEM